MVDAVLGMSEYNRFSKGIFEWVGFRTKWLEFQNIGRCAGETKWSVKKLFFQKIAISFLITIPSHVPLLHPPHWNPLR